MIAFVLSKGQPTTFDLSTRTGLTDIVFDFSQGESGERKFPKFSYAYDSPRFSNSTYFETGTWKSEARISIDSFVIAKTAEDDSKSLVKILKAPEWPETAKRSCFSQKCFRPYLLTVFLPSVHQLILLA